MGGQGSRALTCFSIGGECRRKVELLPGTGLQSGSISGSGLGGWASGMRSSEGGICGTSGGFGALTAVGLGCILDLSARAADRTLFDRSKRRGGG